MRIWNQVEKTNPKYTRDVNVGRKFTAIDANYQVMKATEVFGPFGMGWGVKESKFSLLTVDPNDAHYNLLQYTGILWFKDGAAYGEFDITSDIELFEEVNDKATGGKKWKRVEESHKKVSTDAMTKGLSRLGFSADVFLKKFDDSRYVQSLRNEFRDQEQRQQQQQAAPVQQQAAPASQAPTAPLASEALKNDVMLAAQAAGLDGKGLQPILKNRGMAWNRLTQPQAESLIKQLNERAAERKQNLALSAEYEASMAGGAV
jgi:hypothetical protein